AGSFDPAALWGAGQFDDASGWAVSKYGTTIMFADLNHNGKDDVCGRGTAGILCATSNGTGFAPMSLWSSYFSDSQGWGAADYYYGSLRLGDVDGDGYADVCGHGSAGVLCALNTHFGGFAPATWWTNGEFNDASGWANAQYGTTIQLGDVDGDGRADVCGR